METTIDQALLVFTNVPSEPVAQAIARQLIEQRLAACVNVLPGVRSIYQWQGVVEEASEITLLIKTTAARYAEVEQAIRSAHPYEVPEIIATPVIAGLPAYLAWVATETKKEMNV